MYPTCKENTAFAANTANSPATFEKLIDTILRGFRGMKCLVYLDDIIVVGKTLEEHLQNVKNV